MALYLTDAEQRLVCRLLQAVADDKGLAESRRERGEIQWFSQDDQRAATMLLPRVSDPGIVLDPTSRYDHGHHCYSVSRTGHDYDITTSRGEKIGTALHHESAAAICQALDQFDAEKLPETLPDGCLLEATAEKLTLEPADELEESITLVRGERKRIVGGSLGYLLTIDVDGCQKQYVTDAGGFRTVLPGSEK